MVFKRITMILLLLFIFNQSNSFAQVYAFDTTMSINPKETYLRINNDPGTLDAIPLELSVLGISAGDYLILQQLGDYDNGPGGDIYTGMIGVFSSNDSLLDPSQPHRVPGAIDAGEDFTTSPTWNGGLPTDIPEDFFIDSILIQVPDSASFIFVSAHDSWYNDNTDPDNDFAVDIQITSTPIKVYQQHNGNFLKTYRLAQNYPNPFNPATYIEFQIPNSELVNLAVYDVLGRRVATLVDERLPAGVHKLQWNATGLSSGVYLYKLTVRQHTAIRKMVLVK